MSLYLQPQDYAAFGLPSNTNAGQVMQASNLIDAYTKRQPYGFTWSPDYAGNPAYMTGATPTYTLTSTNAINAGQNVLISQTANFLQVGDVLVVDRANNPEVCVISQTSNGTFTLANVALNHAAGFTLEAGLVIFEERTLSRLTQTRVALWPVVNFISAVGRYGFNRRTGANYGLLPELAMFGGLPTWEIINTLNIGITSNTGEILIPGGIYLSNFNEVRMWYVAGWSYQNLPNAIKQACASLVNNQTGPTGGVKMYKAGDTAIERFSESNIDTDTQAMLQPFCAAVMG